MSEINYSANGNGQARKITKIRLNVRLQNKTGPESNNRDELRNSLAKTCKFIVKAKQSYD